ncbi:MAG TPA: tol-pal system-associated acyl-CoA thioesterase [Steroidobacteraceae bacterium]|nr:tol-pal system-associated acyl-CoA thioesterase [Steroidobacteraceae bacterium]
MAAEFRWPVRVYYEDTDAGGVVYHTGYIRYFERARTEWLRARGYSQQRLTQEEGMLFTVVDLAIHYRKPARLDDLLEVVTRAEAAGASMLFAQAVRAPDGALLAEGEVRVACIDARTFRPRRLPGWLLAGNA